MRNPWKLLLSFAAVLVFVSCATEPPSPPEEVVSEPEVAEPEVTEVEKPEVEVDPLAESGVAYFETASGVRFQDGSSVTLPTGGPPAGRIVPRSDNPDVVLYITRDGSKPSVSNNWDGAISPAEPLPIARQSEGAATYRIVAELGGKYSEPFTVNVVWQHETDATVAAPRFIVDGDEVSGTVSLPVSDGSLMSGRLYIECDYSEATLYITNDSTDPSADNHLYAQTSGGTYLYSPAADDVTYRVVAVWHGSTSAFSGITVTWSE